MNPFVTDHPMMDDPPPAVLRHRRRLLRRTLTVIAGYAGYLLLLGPLAAWEQRGRLEFMPSPLRGMLFWPAYPVSRLPAVGMFYFHYLEWWADAQNTTPGPASWR